MFTADSGMMAGMRSTVIESPLALVVSLWFAAFLPGCPNEPRQSTPPAGGSTSVVAAPQTVDVEGAYRCKQDADCTITCAQGAVNRTWYETNERRLTHCKDGCVGWGKTRATCVDATCVAMHDGKRDEGCTRKTIRWAGE